MANATDIVKKGTVRRTDEFTRLPLSDAASARTFWPNAMLGVGADGFVDKFDDTQALTFVGVFRGLEGKFVQPVSANGDYEIDVHQPQAFELAVSGVAVADVGRLVYASDDQTGTLTPTAFANVVGVVKRRVSAGIALVEPRYVLPFTSGTVVDLMAADGAIPIKTGTVVVTKAGVCAMTLAAPTAGVDDGKRLTVVSATAQAHTLTQASPGFNNGGAASDVGTFGAAVGNGIELIAYNGVWLTVGTPRGVTLA